MQSGVGAAPLNWRALIHSSSGSKKSHSRPLTVWQKRGTPDQSLLESVRNDLAKSGYKLKALWELLEDGNTTALYLEESMAELGLTVPADIAAALNARGLHPLNWDELTGKG